MRPTTVGVNPFRDRLGYWVDRVVAGEEVIVTRHGKPRIRLSPVVPAAPDGFGAAGPPAPSHRLELT